MIFRRNIRVRSSEPFTYAAILKTTTAWIIAN
ncbi:unnamed protein product [Onchocerca flexuosa]|uniref:Uncharacterized protein n=1 Tax=Onchocerca flexuosa TaxID=387005 RepID=A0A183HI44_9BILA|nr:unnamed protein product [Onchocerca flexuosa]